MQGPETPQNIAETETAKTRNFNVPSCPTQPRMAESVPPNIENLVAGDRAQIEQADLVINASNTVTAAIPKTKFMVQQTLPWYQRLLSFAFPSTVMANITPAAGFTETLQGRANTTGRANELQQQNFEKLISDLRSHPDMAAEQQFANTMSRMLEEKNKALRSQLEFVTAHNENEQDIAYDSVMSQY
jgi:hypothetical protein